MPSPPAESDLLRVDVDTTYGPQPSGGDAGLVPASSTLTMFPKAGGKATNRTTYRSCRSFSSNSTLSFELSSRLPAGLEVRSTLLAPIDSRSASVGDLFQARLAGPVRQGNEILVPDRATVHGRIVKLEQTYYPNVSVRVLLRFDSVEFGGRQVPIAPAEPIATVRAFGKDYIRLDTRTVMRWVIR